MGLTAAAAVITAHPSERRNPLWAVTMLTRASRGGGRRRMGVTATAMAIMERPSERRVAVSCIDQLLTD